MAMAAMTTMASPSQSFLPARNHLAPHNRRNSSMRFGFSSVRRLQSPADSQPLTLLAKLPMQEFLWRGIRELGDGACLRAVQSETSEVSTDEGKELLGGGNGGNSNGEGGGGNNGGGGEALGWISSALVFAFYGALLYYGLVLAPAQTPYRDQYFIEKLVGLRSNDGFVINTILFCEFYIMGLWPIIYACLLLPSARNKKGGVPAWPFILLSFGIGAGALVPYFGLWQPPPPKVTKAELRSFPLTILENKLLAYGVLLGGAGLFLTAALAPAEQWTEMFQYVRESRFIHVMSVDFLTLSSLAPFWVYNDMATRRWLDKGSWLLPLSLVPFFGPALYLVLRPPLPLSMVEDES
ncbi:hypothetical protein M758_12G022100 [Ceratodon purpureus]|nr:hypothetical protein M758_12G022100 [Ceratodon purpureus]